MYLPPAAMEATLREVVAAAAGRDGAMPVRAASPSASRRGGRARAARDAERETRARGPPASG